MEGICEVCRSRLDKNVECCPGCGAAVHPPDPGQDSGSGLVNLATGTVIGQKYVILERLGQGGFGSVFRVLHTMLQREFALKTLHPSLVHDPGVRERFFREARVLLDLTHPNIVTVRDVGQFQGLLYMVMDLVPGETLEAMLKREGRLPGPEVVELALALLDGLEAAHRKGVIHRDLKPANVMVSLDKKGRRSVRILDFGIAKIMELSPKDEASLTAGVVIGTPQYMSPEQAQGEQLDPRSDIYSLGAMLYQTVTGKRPYAGAHGYEVILHVLKDPVAPFAESGTPDDPPGLEAILRRALEKDPEQRPPSAAEMRAMLERVAPRAAGGRGGGARGGRSATRKIGAPAAEAPKAERPAPRQAAIPPAPVAQGGARHEPALEPIAKPGWRPPPSAHANLIVSPHPPDGGVRPPPSEDDGHIVFLCVCGRRITVRDAHAGELGWCPHCWHALRVPVPDRLAPNTTTYFTRCSHCHEVVEVGEHDSLHSVLCGKCAAGHRVLV